MFTKGQWITLVVIAVALMLLVAGCSASPPASETTTFPVGTYRAIDAAIHAEFVAEFKSDGTYKISLNGAESGGGTFTVAQNQVTITGGPCTGADKETGTYTWKMDGNKLFFTAAKEQCNDRWRAFNLVWTKQ